MSPLPSDNTDWTINTSPPTPGGFVQITYDGWGRSRRVRRPGADDERWTLGTTTERVTLTVT